MARYDRVLIDPDRDELTSALHEAVLAANDKRRSRLLHWPLSGLADLESDLDSAEGWRQWNGGEGPVRPGEGRSVVALAWWTDRLGRKHHRLVARHGIFNRPMLENIFCPLGGDMRPALWFVYPDHVLLKRDGNAHSELHAMCACGAWGRPEELGWMGPSCDACYDRGQEGQVGSPAWLDPRCGTFRGEEGRLAILAYSPDGRTLAAGTTRDRVTLFDTSTGESRGRLQATSGEWLLNVAWLDNGARLVTCGVDGRLRFWSGRTGLPTDTRETGGASECFSVSPDGRILARSDRQHTQILTVQDNTPVLELPSGMSCMTFSPDGRFLAGGTRQGGVTIWDVSSGEVRGQFQQPGAIVAGLSFSAHGLILAAAMIPGAGNNSRDAHRILLWDTQTRSQRQSLPGHEGGTRCVAFAPDGRLLASGGEDGLVRLWEPHSGRLRVALDWHLDCVCSLAFAPDGLSLASGSFDGTIKLWPRELLRPVEIPREVVRQ